MKLVPGALPRVEERSDETSVSACDLAETAGIHGWNLAAADETWGRSRLWPTPWAPSARKSDTSSQR
ncbi:hypothetical protein ACIRQY_33515 [Streptomyces sp. NPDC101490]|uniref:hypothetical protein n=1 Tax=Streptomyces sp. NPDC101490 TaxID=3366143 RepID=UPI00381DE101